jgi:heme-degrading monooxygenase HmoA
VIVRVWRTKIDPGRIEEYQRFEQERCMPILRKQPGLLGELFRRQAEDQAASLTIWEDAGVVEALQSSPSYRETAHGLAESALLARDQSVEVFEVEGGDLVRRRWSGHSNGRVAPVRRVHPKRGPRLTS